MADLDAIFKAYDVRGLYPDQIDGEVSGRIGAAFAKLMQREHPDLGAVVVGHDMRPSGEELVPAFSDGVTSQGLDVVAIGLASTDMLYYASGSLGLPGAVFTASHNPAGYNGVKLCRPGAAPVGVESGLAEIKAMVQAGVEPTGSVGRVETRSMLDDFSVHVRSFVDPEKLRPLKVVADTANGMGGLVVPGVFSPLPFELEILYPELDGTFPNHPADPIDVENLRDLRARVLETGADVGLAFDGDADRVFLVDEAAEPISGSITTAIVAAGMLDKHPGATVIHNLICSKVVPEIIEEHGGVAVRSRVGHSYIKQLMAETGAVFAGEHSGHYYFRDNYRADSGMLAMLVLLQALSDDGRPLSQVRGDVEPYAQSGEINLRVDDQTGAMRRVAAAFPDGNADWTDGLTVEWDDRWFNLRPSNTEPVLRLNVEATVTAGVASLVDAVSDILVAR